MGGLSETGIGTFDLYQHNFKLNI